jgi:hypothetical protein
LASVYWISGGLVGRKTPDQATASCDAETVVLVVAGANDDIEFLSRWVAT